MDFFPSGEFPSSSLKASGMISVFKSRPYVKKESNSDMAVRRRKLDQLEQLLKDFLPLLQYLNETKSSSAKVFKEYFIWVQNQLKVFREEPKAFSPHSLEKKIAQFDVKLKVAFNYLNLISSEYNSNSSLGFLKGKVRSSLVPDVQTKFVKFIEKGLLVYPAFIDFYGLLLSPSELDIVLFKKEYDYLSYTVLAIMAKVILPETSQEFQVFYPNFLEHSITSIAQCYITPSIEGIVSLVFLSMIYILEFKGETAMAYFASALKMFQIVDQEKSSSHFMSIFKESHFSKTEALRKALTLTSTIYNTFMPEAPPFDFDPQPISFSFNADIHQRKLDYTNSYMRSVHNLSNQKIANFNFENRIIELFTTIASHIQVVRKKYRPFNQPELVPPAELRLPLKKYNKTFKLLLDLEETFEKGIKTGNNLFFAEDFFLISYIDNDTSECNIPMGFSKNISLLFIHSVLLLLIYPSVLVVPSPILFPLNEMQTLFKAANTIAEYYIETISKHRMVQSQLLNSRATHKASQGKISIPHIVFSPHPISLIYPAYVYLNLISFSHEPIYCSFSKDDLLKCESVILGIFKTLKEISQSKTKIFSIEAGFAIKKLIKSLPRYNIPQQFHDKVKEILNIDITENNRNTCHIFN